MNGYEEVDKEIVALILNMLENEEYNVIRLFTRR